MRGDHKKGVTLRKGTSTGLPVADHIPFQNRAQQEQGKQGKRSRVNQIRGRLGTRMPKKKGRCRRSVLQNFAARPFTENAPHPFENKQKKQGMKISAKKKKRPDQNITDPSCGKSP